MLGHAPISTVPLSTLGGPSVTIVFVDGLEAIMFGVDRSLITVHLPRLVDLFVEPIAAATFGTPVASSARNVSSIVAASFGTPHALFSFNCTSFGTPRMSMIAHEQVSVDAQVESLEVPSFGLPRLRVTLSMLDGIELAAFGAARSRISAHEESA
jgi:hypothetical protein